MRIWLLAVGSRRSRWERDGFTEYARRLPRSLALELREVGAERRLAGLSGAHCVEREGQRLLGAVPRGARIIALDERGVQWRSDELAGELEGWQREARDVALLIGGADGLGEAVRRRAERVWSLSALTLPHGLVRIVVAEQLYRAWSLLAGHPYHRG